HAAARDHGHDRRSRRHDLCHDDLPVHAAAGAGRETVMAPRHPRMPSIKLTLEFPSPPTPPSPPTLADLATFVPPRCYAEKMAKSANFGESHPCFSKTGL